jgi:hypothetical protein
VDVDVRLRVLRLEGGEQRGERVVADRQRCAKVQPAGSGVGELLHLAFELRHVVEHGARALREETARVGEDRTALHDVDERHGEVILQRAHLQGDRRLCQFEFFSRAREVAELGEPAERVQLCERNRHRAGPVLHARAHPARRRAFACLAILYKYVADWRQSTTARPAGLGDRPPFP